MQLSVLDPEGIMLIKNIIMIANVAILILLLSIYVKRYIKIKSKFTLGLIIFSFLLLLQAITSTPCIFAFTCEHHYCVIELIDVVPDILEFMALIVLVYLSSE